MADQSPSHTAIALACFWYPGALIAPDPLGSVEIFLLMKSGTRIMMTNHGADYFLMPEMYSGEDSEIRDFRESSPVGQHLSWAARHTNEAENPYPWGALRRGFKPCVLTTLFKKIAMCQICSSQLPVNHFGQIKRVRPPRFPPKSGFTELAFTCSMSIFKHDYSTWLAPVVVFH